jgi:hypothetical protein
MPTRPTALEEATKVLLPMCGWYATENVIGAAAALITRREREAKIEALEKCDQMAGGVYGRMGLLDYVRAEIARLKGENGNA